MSHWYKASGCDFWSLVALGVSFASFRPGEHFEITTVICPCRDGTIIVNGTRLPGEVRVPEDPMASSAFLAFSETWVARE